MSEHFDSYAHLFTLEEVIRSNFLHDCPEPLRRHIFRDKNILRAILLADKNILDEMAFFLRLTSIEEDSLNVLYEVLDEIEAGENYFDIYSHWFPENPLKWIRNIQPDQSASIRKLQKQGIDLEEDVSSS